MFPLAIIRLVFIVLVLIVLAVVSSVASLGADFSKPFPPWRRAIVHLLRPLAKCVVWGLGYSVTVYGWENYLEALRRDVVRAHSSFELYKAMTRPTTQL